MESYTSSEFALPPARPTDSGRPIDYQVEGLASETDELQRIVQIFIRLRSRRLEQEGVNLPLLVVVTDASGRESCPVELLELLGGSRLWPSSCGTGPASPPFAIALHARGCRQADEPSSYAIEYNDVKKKLADLYDFPAEIYSAIEHLHHEIETELHEEPIFLRLCSERHAELAGVFFRWEKCSDDVETLHIEYQLPDQPVVKQVSWKELEDEIYAARTSMANSNVMSEILLRARSPDVHPIPTVFKLDGCPTVDCQDIIAYNGRTRRIQSRENIKSEIESARMVLTALRRKRGNRSPIVLHVRQPTAIDLIRVDLPTDMADDSAGNFVQSVAALIAQLLKPARESLVLTVLSADEEHSTAFDCGLSHVLDKIAMLQTIDDMRWSLVRQIQERQWVKRVQLRNIPARRGTNLRTGLELLKIRRNVFKDLEQFMLCGGIAMFSDNEVLHFATRVSSIFRKYKKQLLPEEDVFPPTDDLPDANAVEAKEDCVDPIVLLKLSKQFDKIQEWSITLVDELHDYTKLFVFYVLENYISSVPHLLKKYREAAVEALREACAVSRDFISCSVGDEKAIAVGLDVGGLPVTSTIYLRRRYKLVQNKITLKLTTLFSEAVDTHMKTKLNERTHRVNKSILRELSILYYRRREDLKARILILKDSIEDLSY